MGRHVIQNLNKGMLESSILQNNLVIHCTRLINDIHIGDDDLRVVGLVAASKCL